MLLTGPPGLGKTTLARICAKMIDDCTFKEKNGTSFTTVEKIRAIGLEIDEEKRVVLFIDEIHKIKKSVQEMFLAFMEDGQIEVLDRQLHIQGATKTLTIDNFTIIGATTNESSLSKPMLDRFGAILLLEPYSMSEMKNIVKRAAKEILHNTVVKFMSEKGIELIAERSRGTVRVANNNLYNIVDYINTNKVGKVDATVVRKAFRHFGINKWGLTKPEVKILTALAKFAEPVSLSMLSGLTHLEESAIRSVHEPYVISKYYMIRTGKGRALTPEGKKVMDAFKKGNQY